MTTSTNEITTEQKLLSSLEDMHNIASESLSRIKGISKCALRSLETESGARDLEALAEALTAIILDADMAHNDVGCQAEAHGIQTVDQSWLKRLAAMPRAVAAVMPTTSGRA